MTGTVFSSDPLIARKNLQWLEAIMLDDKDWLDDATRKDPKKEISDWAYDAEDALDDWRFELLRAEAERPPKQGAGGRNVRGAVADLQMDPSFRDRVNALLRKRRSLWEAYGQLSLEGLQPQGGGNAELPSTSPPTEPKIHGREDDKEVLVGFLLHEAVEDKLSVVPVVGATGVGKTTLLQLICDDDMVSQHFDLKKWATASGGRQMIEVMKEIAESLTGGPCNATQLGVIQNLLMQKLQGLKFFLVLDDVRYETIDGGQWEKLRSIFSNCADGSVVILTTQEERVAERMGTVPPYMLESLSGDLCWSVFRKHAFSGFLPTDEELVEIGQKIAEECQGSPLVAKALGIRLCNERDVAVWKKFLERRVMWDEVVPELKLSYHRLPAHLKRCFVYCSMFPEGYLFSREELVRLWTAQGFIREEKGRSLEEVGIKYFDDLIIRSFFQKSEQDAGAFVMPNLLHALAQSISNGECITTENSDLSNPPNNYVHKPRHLSFTPSNNDAESNNNVASDERDLEEQFNEQSCQIIHKQAVGDVADSSIKSQSDCIDDQNSSAGCKTLPQLGLLPLLKELLVDGMSLEHIETFWIEECEKLSISVPDQLEICKLSSTTFISQVIEDNTD